jgi:hypothetical protein
VHEIQEIRCGLHCVCAGMRKKIPLGFYSAAARVRGKASKRRQLDKTSPAVRVNSGGPQASRRGSGGPQVSLGRRKECPFGRDSTRGDKTATAGNRGHQQRGWGGLCRCGGTHALCESERGALVRLNGVREKADLRVSRSARRRKGLGIGGVTD